METPEPWACKLRHQRNISDFRRWKDHDAYKRSFERVVRDLTSPRQAARARDFGGRNEPRPEPHRPELRRENHRAITDGSAALMQARFRVTLALGH